VVSLEITKMSLYEERSHNQLYRGHVEIHVTVVDVKNPEEGAVLTKPYVCEYPDLGSVPVDQDESMHVFRAKFIDKMSRDLSRWFAQYPTETKHDFE
jgi:hypothetical protein